MVKTVHRLLPGGSAVTKRLALFVLGVFQALAAGGVGSIVRVLTARKTV